MSRAEILSFSCGHGDEGCFTDLTMALCLSAFLKLAASPLQPVLIIVDLFLRLQLQPPPFEEPQVAHPCQQHVGSNIYNFSKKKMYHKWPISESPEIPFKILKFPLFHPWHPCLKISSISPSKELSTSLRSHRLAASLAVQPSNLTPTWDHPTVEGWGKSMGHLQLHNHVEAPRLMMNFHQFPGVAC